MKNRLDKIIVSHEYWNRKVVLTRNFFVFSGKYWFSHWQISSQFVQVNRSSTDMERGYERRIDRNTCRSETRGNFIEFEQLSRQRSRRIFHAFLSLPVCLKFYFRFHGDALFYRIIKYKKKKMHKKTIHRNNFVVIVIK